MKLSVKRIQKELFNFYKEKGYLYFSANTYGIGFECDFIAVSPKNIMIEVEIKRSKADYWKDFTKEDKHNLIKFGTYPANYFYFCCEDNLIASQEVPYPYGLISISKCPYLDKNKRKKYDYRISILKKAAPIHQKKLDDYLLIKILSSMSYKWFQTLKIKD